MFGLSVHLKRILKGIVKKYSGIELMPHSRQSLNMFKSWLATNNKLQTMLKLIRNFGQMSAFQSSSAFDCSTFFETRFN